MPQDMFSLFLGATIKAAGSMASGKAREDIYNLKADVYDRQADFETIKSDYEVDKVRSKTEKIKATQRNVYLGMGFQLEGTPLEVAWDTDTEASKDIFAIRLGSEIRKANYKVEAWNNRALGIDAMNAGKIGAYSAALDAYSGGGKESGKQFGQDIVKLGSNMFAGGG